ncbi:PepSY-associated TM helix domain-containing protein [Photobacterium galatheae]|uniref:Membrane protein n=1 Tax=Photobacterium galatheae TaxID=1654360 RepID=A0A066S0A2_9GAMM|nr:PepSY domain-containing protein [Photobacterium galatheae]KDM93367.1 membrane protein [Photobacterium galatheae]MCM0150490.1 PepSY domain-containing protein [Photobacterium galatheae]
MKNQNDSTSQQEHLPEQRQTQRAWYMTAWRWHFYAGLYVVPFLIMLSVTGLMMLYAGSIDNLRLKDLLFVEPAAQTVPVTQQFDAVQQAYPDATIKQYLTPKQPEDVSRFAVVSAAGQGLFVTVNPYTAEVLGSLDRDNNLYAWAESIHGTLLMGDMGDRLIELAASFAVILIVSGAYLWWPRDNASKAGMFRIRLTRGKRTFWRDLHANLGVVTAVFLLLFLLSGLSWSGIWGSKMVQAWNTFPTGVFGDVPLSDAKHAEMNHGDLKEVPWNLEQTAMPLSTPSHAGHHDGQETQETQEKSTQGNSIQGNSTPRKGIQGEVNLDSVVAFARVQGFTAFRVNLPKGEQGSYSILQSTMSNDITDATQDRTLHLNQYTGDVLADIKYSQYSPMAKAMAWGIALHEGDFGGWNKAVNTLLCLSFILISASGVVMWWLRRPKGKVALSAPPAPENMALWKGATVVIAVLGVCFPLAGIAMVTVLLADRLVFARVPTLARFFS